MTVQTTGTFVPTDSLANRLILVRRELGNISQREAAARCGVGYGAWQGWENGSPPKNALRDLIRVAQTLNVDRDWLLFGGPLRVPEEPPAPVKLEVVPSSPIPGNMRDEPDPRLSTAEIKAHFAKRIPLRPPVREPGMRAVAA